MHFRSRIKLCDCVCRWNKKKAGWEDGWYTFCLLHRPGHPPSSLRQNAHDREESAADFFIPPTLPLLPASYPPFISKWHPSTSALHLPLLKVWLVWECVLICMCVYICPVSLLSPSSPPWLWHSTHPPPLLPPIIEADSASQACTRHTRWLQQLERSLGHYGSLHYGKRRRREEEQLR